MHGIAVANKAIDFERLRFHLMGEDSGAALEAMRSLTHSARGAILRKKIPETLLVLLPKCLKSEALEIRSRAAEIIGYVAFKNLHNQQIIPVTVIPDLIELLGNSNLRVQKSALRALSSLSLNALHQKAILDGHGVLLLLTILKDALDEEAKSYAAYALRNILHKVDQQTEAVENECFNAYVSLLKNEHQEIKKDALRTIDYLTRNPLNHATIFSNTDLIKALRSLLETFSTDVDAEIVVRSKAILGVLPKALVVIPEAEVKPADTLEDEAAPAGAGSSGGGSSAPLDVPSLTIALPLNPKYLEMLVPGIRDCQTYYARDENDEEPAEFIAIVKTMPKLVTFNILSGLPDVLVPAEAMTSWRFTSGVFQYDLQWRPPVSGDADDHYVFVFAGRKLGAHIPPEGVGLCPIVVVTKEEYVEIHPKIPSYCGVLIIQSLSVNEVAYDPKTLVARRLAGFIAAYHLDVAHCFVTDDNIKSIHFADDALKPFSGLIALMGDFASQAIETAMSYDKVRSARRPGDKFFCLNIAKLKTRFSTVTDAFQFMFPVPLERALLEDYFMQFVWEKMFPSRGFGVFPKNAVLLDRSASQRSLFKKASGTDNPLQKTLEWRLHVTEALLGLYRPEYKLALEDLGTSVGETVKESREKVEQYQRTDVYARHARARGVNPDGARDLSVLHPTELEMTDPSVEKFFAYLHRIMTEHREAVGELLRLRSYQLDALQAFVDHKKLDSLVVLATGCGKTFLEIALLILTRLYYGPRGPSVLLIAPTQDLVEQAYQDFQTLKLESDRFSLTRIISVMSDVAIATTLSEFSGDSSAPHGGVVIMCDGSFANLLKQISELKEPEKMASSRLLLERCPVIIFDEAHLKQETRAKARRFCSGAALLSLTATPPGKNIPICEYGRRDAVKAEVLPPAVVLKFKKNYSKTRAAKCVKHITEHLQSIFLPDGKPLSSRCGIIYVNSIKIAKSVATILTGRIAATAIHSEDDKNSKEVLKRFKSGSHPEILVVVDKLKIGFSCSRVAWVMCLTSSRDANDVVQRAGRAYRQGEHKVGLFIGFANANISGLAIDGPKLPGGSYDKEAEAHLHPAFKTQLEIGLKTKPVIIIEAEVAGVGDKRTAGSAAEGDILGSRKRQMVDADAGGGSSADVVAVFYHAVAPVAASAACERG